MIPGIPSSFIGIVVGVVTGAHVDDGHFKDLGWIAGKAIEELACGCIGEDGVF
jgi:hypothetical protein